MIMRINTPKTRKQVVLSVLALGAVVYFAFPFVWMVLTSLKTPPDLFTIPARFLPEHGFDLSPYLVIWTRQRFGLYFLNTVRVAFFAVSLSVAAATLAGLGFSRYKFPFRHQLMLMSLLGQLFPLVLLVMPFYFVWRQWGILDTHLSLVLSYTAFSLPYSIWMLTGYFGAIPVELEESAMIDGTSRFGAYIRVTLPLAAPGVVATIVYCTILAWNEFLFATTFISTPRLQTLTIGLNRFIDQYEIAWNMLMAGAVITTLPVVLLFIFLQKFLIKGMTAGAVKT